MKKRVILSVVITVCLFITIGCSRKKENVEEISMIIKEGTLTNTSATIIISDNTNKNYVYAEDFKIQKKVRGRWKDLPSKTIFFNALGYYVDENGKLEMECNWKSMYGELEKGMYRIIKTAGNMEIYADFAIN